MNVRIVCDLKIISDRSIKLETQTFCFPHHLPSPLSPTGRMREAEATESRRSLITIHIRSHYHTCTRIACATSVLLAAR